MAFRIFFFFPSFCAGVAERTAASSDTSFFFAHSFAAQRATPFSSRPAVASSRTLTVRPSAEVMGIVDASTARATSTAATLADEAEPSPEERPVEVAPAPPPSTVFVKAASRKEKM